MNEIELKQKIRNEIKKFAIDYEYYHFKINKMKLGIIALINLIVIALLFNFFPVIFNVITVNIESLSFTIILCFVLYKLDVKKDKMIELIEKIWSE